MSTAMCPASCEYDSSMALARAEGEAAGRAAERAAVVAWLHRQGGRAALVQDIERGEHRRVCDRNA